jgi:hypothetical protein
VAKLATAEGLKPSVREDLQVRILPPLPFTRAVALGMVVVLATGCALIPRRQSATPENRAAAWIREGPVAVGADVLLDHERQKAYFGRTFDSRVFRRATPVALIMRNAGARRMLVRLTDTALELRPSGVRATALDRDGVLAMLTETYAALEPETLERRYPVTETLGRGAVLLCLGTLIGCIALPPAFLIGGVADASRLASEKVRETTRVRSARAVVREMLERAGGPDAQDPVTLATGDVVRTLVYFPLPAVRFDVANAATLTVRFEEVTGATSPVVVVLPLIPGRP